MHWLISVAAFYARLWLLIVFVTITAIPVFALGYELGGGDIQTLLQLDPAQLATYALGGTMITLVAILAVISKKTDSR